MYGHVNRNFKNLTLYCAGNCNCPLDIYSSGRYSKDWPLHLALCKKDPRRDPTVL